VQNPSAFLTIEAILLKSFFRYILVVDAHNAGVYPFEKHQDKFAKIFPFMHRYADLTVVTNSALSALIEKNGGHPFILPDPLPEFGSTPKTIKDQEGFIVTFICSFATDEPYLEVMKTVRYLPDDIRIYITGNDSKLTESERLQAGAGIVFTGFMEDGEFVQQLSNSDAIMDLTIFQDCLVCGAYEGVSLGVPLILSDTPALRSWFYKGAVYTNGNAKDLANAVLRVRAERKSLIREVRLLRDEMSARWNDYFAKFQQVLHNMLHSRSR